MDIRNPATVVPAGTAARTVVGDTTVVVRDPDRRLRDLSWTPDEPVEVKPVTASSDAGRTVLRHSAALILARAVQQLFAQAKLAMGAPTEDGFYYDFEVPRPITAADLVELERLMEQSIAAGRPFTRRELGSVEEARGEFATEPYKLELLDLRESGNPRVGSRLSVIDIAGVMGVASDLTVYEIAGPERVWRDLSQGPHISSTADLPAVKLLRVEQVRWDGAEHKVLYRIHGTAWESAEALADHLRLLEAAAGRDHRVLGRDLDLFSFPDAVGSGLPVFHPKGGALRREIEAHSLRRHLQDGFEFVYTPHVSHTALIGGTWPLELYRDSVYPAMHIDAESDEGGTVLGEGLDYLLKPMNCPYHNLIYSARERSQAELPLRLFEMSAVYRYEPEPSHGLTATRGMTMDDTHIFCTPDQLRGELRSLLASIVDVLGDYGFADLRLVLNTRDDDFFVGTDEQWGHATAALSEAGAATGLRLTENPAGAQFYGPNLHVHVVDELGRSWKVSTLLVDFNLPDRDGLRYTAADGTTRQPVMIHRSLLGSIERFIGILTEHYAGAFPAWLAPVQVACIPATGTQTVATRNLATALRSSEIRVDLDLTDASIPHKIATHAAQLVPFVLIVAADTVSLRFRDGDQVDGIPAETAITTIQRWLTRRTNTTPTAASLLQPEVDDLLHDLV